MALINITNGLVNTLAAQLPNVLSIYNFGSDVINGGNVGIIGIVGTAQGGDVNKVMKFNSASDAALTLGLMQDSVYDLMSSINDIFDLARNYGSAIQVNVVRVTDGSQTNASVAVKDVTAGTPVTGMTVTALTSGMVANNFIVQITAGSLANTYRVIVARKDAANQQEVYDNIAGTGATLWQNMVNAINSGQGALRAQSALVMATIGTATAAPALATYNLAGGTNGNATITDSTLVGASTGTLTGMYALDTSGFNVMMLCGVTDTSTFVTQDGFAQSNAAEAILQIANGTSTATTATLMQTAGITSEWSKVLAGDFRYFQDTDNKKTRLIPMQARVASLRAILPPERSTLNQNMFMSGGSTFRTKNKQPYTQTEMIQLQNAGVDFVSQGSDAGQPLYVCRLGINTNPDLGKRDDHVCMIAAFIANSVAPFLGKSEGRLDKPSVLKELKAQINQFGRNLVRRERLRGFTPVISNSNNSIDALRQGILRVDIEYDDYDTIRTIYLGVNRKTPNNISLNI